MPVPDLRPPIRGICGRLLTASLAAIALAGCVERGDFGRPKTHSVWNEALAATGSIAAARREEPVSPFPYTDDERELRDRAFRFLTPAAERPWFDRALGDLAAKRVLPPGSGLTDRTAYARGLAAEGGISPTSRYRRLGEDASADLRLIPGFAAVARRVLVADGVRLKTLSYAADVSEADGIGAEMRVAENRCLVAWVAAGLDARLAGYAYALEHLVIESPQPDAVPSERSVTALGAARGEIAALDPPALSACGGTTKRMRTRDAVPVVVKG